MSETNAMRRAAEIAEGCTSVAEAAKQIRREALRIDSLNESRADQALLSRAATTQADIPDEPGQCPECGRPAGRHSQLCINMGRETPSQPVAPVDTEQKFVELLDMQDAKPIPSDLIARMDAVLAPVVPDEPPIYGIRKAIGLPVGYIDTQRQAWPTFCRLNDLHGIPHNTKVYAVPDPFVRELRRLLQTMINSAEVFVGEDDTIIGYKIKTGALHKIVGLFADADDPLTMPASPHPAPPQPSINESPDGDKETRDACIPVDGLHRKVAAAGAVKEAGLDAQPSSDQPVMSKSMAKRIAAQLEQEPTAEDFREAWDDRCSTQEACVSVVMVSGFDELLARARDIARERKA